MNTPKKFAMPMPKVVRARPVTFWFVLVFLQKGAAEIASAYSLNDYAASIITGIILFCILGSEFFINTTLIS